jgi:multiple sugar transport system substrate-binding protein
MRITSRGTGRNRARVARLSLAVVAAGAIAMTGCTAAPPADDGPIELTFWAWAGGVEDAVALYKDVEPNVTINVENVGFGTDVYTKIENVIDAGSGGPDLSQMDYYAIPSFALSGALADLSTLGAADAEDLFLPGAWQNVVAGDGIFGIPQDIGPQVMFYRSDILDQLGLDVPTTWDEYAQFAEAVHASDPTRYATFLDPGLAEQGYSGIWQAGGQPWSIQSDTELSLDFSDAGTTKFADYWTDLLSRDLVTVATQGSDEWFRALADGKLVSWMVGSWGYGPLAGVIPENEGLWRAALQPVWEAGDKAASQFGGGGTVVLSSSAHQQAAADFAIWLNSDPKAVAALQAAGLTPTAASVWNDPAFLDTEIPYLGGQQANQVFSEAAEETVPGWRWLPIMVYATSVYKDTVGQAIADHGDLNDGFAAFQERLAEYATQQGFTVNQ